MVGRMATLAVRATTHLLPVHEHPTVQVPLQGHRHGMEVVPLLRHQLPLLKLTMRQLQLSRRLPQEDLTIMMVAILLTVQVLQHLVQDSAPVP